MQHKVCRLLTKEETLMQQALVLPSTWQRRGMLSRCWMPLLNQAGSPLGSERRMDARSRRA